MQKALFTFYFLLFTFTCFAQDIKLPNAAGAFYPADSKELSRTIDNFLNAAEPQAVSGNIFALISPHAGYEFSGGVAARGYKLIKNKPYKTVIVIGPSHHYGFRGASVYPDGIFKTPLGDLEIDAEFTQKLLDKDKDIFFAPRAFSEEHSIEVQLPFLQKVLSGGSTALWFDKLTIRPEQAKRVEGLTISPERSQRANFKIVPIVMGDCDFSICQKLANLLKKAMGQRQDVLVVASTDMYHGYDYEMTEIVDNLTLSYLKQMEPNVLYEKLKSGAVQLCGGIPVVTTLLLANELGHNKLKVLKYTNSAYVTGRKIKGAWTVGYASCAVDKEGEKEMLNIEQRKKLLKLARSSIEIYLKTGKKLELTETDPLLRNAMGAFVTLHKDGDLRGCIGHLISDSPLYLTIRDMAVESAVGDPRFSVVTLDELKHIEIEISVLSPMKRVYSSDAIQLGIHGVLLRQGSRSGVFLPQVAAETGWSKEEFLSNLCEHKAGLSPDAWKDKSTEIYIFSAEIFSEKKIQ